MTQVIEALKAAQVEVREAAAEESRLAAEVKELHNTIYAPLCEQKKAATKRADAARAALKQLMADNAELVEAVRGIRPAK